MHISTPFTPPLEKTLCCLGFGQCQDPTEHALYSLLANKPVPLTAANQPDLQIFVFFPLQWQGHLVNWVMVEILKMQQVSVCCEIEKMRERAHTSLPGISQQGPCLCNSLVA